MRHLELVMPGRDVSQRLHLGLWPGRKRLEHGALVGQERQTPIQLLDYGGDLLAGRAVPSIILNQKKKKHPHLHKQTKLRNLLAGRELQHYLLLFHIPNINTISHYNRQTTTCSPDAGCRAASCPVRSSIISLYLLRSATTCFKLVQRSFAVSRALS
jgi:hypothetical protein